MKSDFGANLRDADLEHAQRRSALFPKRRRQAKRNVIAGHYACSKSAGCIRMHVIVELLGDCHST